MTLVVKKKITFDVLENLGYKLSRNQIPLGSYAQDRYAILEVIEEKGKRKPGFSYLYSLKHMAGVVLPQPYEYFLIHKIKNLTAFLAENDLD